MTLPDNKYEKPAKKFNVKRKYKIIIVVSILFIAWILSDLFGHWHTNLRKFDPEVIAGLETGMWHAYYDKESFHLYRLLVEMLHDQQGFPFLRANYEAYLAAKAAIVFKEGHNRQDYELALPYLIKYYEGMKNIGGLSCNPEQVAKMELEWWIVHRERLHYGKAALVKSVADAAGALYGENPKDLMQYAEARSEAMIIRDEESAGDGVSEKEWKQINSKLIYSYKSLLEELSRNRSNSKDNVNRQNF